MLKVTCISWLTGAVVVVDQVDACCPVEALPHAVVDVSVTVPACPAPPAAALVPARQVHAGHSVDARLRHALVYVWKYNNMSKKLYIMNKSFQSCQNIRGNRRTALIKYIVYLCAGHIVMWATAKKIPTAPPTSQRNTNNNIWMIYTAPFVRNHSKGVVHIFLKDSFLVPTIYKSIITTC